MSSTYPGRRESVRAFLRARPGQFCTVEEMNRVLLYGMAALKSVVADLVNCGQIRSNHKRPPGYAWPQHLAPNGRKPERAAARPTASHKNVAMPREGREFQALDTSILKPLIREGAGGPAVPGVVILPSVYDRGRS